MNFIKSALPSFPASTLCEEGWYYNDTINSCYKILEPVHTWYDARTACVNEGANMLSILSEEEKLYVMGKLIILQCALNSKLGVNNFDVV